MNVLLINGSPHKNGCVFTALSEIAETLHKQQIETSMFQLGTQPVRGCIACMKCREKGEGCVFKDELYVELCRLAKQADGIIVGSPVYYGGPNGSLCALLDRFFFSASALVEHKPAAAIVSCRRGGSTAAFDRLNKYFTISQMPVVSSQYWNGVHGRKPEDVLKDLEGLQIMRTLANNMAWMLRMQEKAALPLPAPEAARQQTNFIR